MGSARIATGTLGSVTLLTPALSPLRGKGVARGGVVCSVP